MSAGARLRRLRPRRSIEIVGAVASALLLGGLLLFSPARAEAAGTIPSTFTLDGITVTLSTAFLPSPTFEVAQPGALAQTAVSSAVDPYRALTLQAIDLGTAAPGEDLPKATASGAPQELSTLAGQRQAEGGAPSPAPPVQMFGTTARGILSQVSLAVTASGNSPVAVAEWVVVSLQRLWILRADEQLTGTFTVPALASLLAGTTVTALAPTPTSTTQAHTSSLVTPLAAGVNAPWWNRTCDAGNNGDGVPLGAVFQGFAACGPRPFTESPPSARDYTVQFFPGAWGEFEFECVELAMRYLYLADGIDPYPANGNQVVTHYPGFVLQKISNGTRGVSPQPGDVISFGADTAAGHVAVVTGNNVNTSGNGTVTVIEENNSASGSNTLNVSNWVVGADAYPTIGWLHRPAVAAAPQEAVSGMTPYGVGMQAWIRATDNSVQQRYWAGAWSAWNSLGGAVEDQPTVTLFDQSFFVFARGLDGALWYRVYAPAGGWSGWGSLFGDFAGDPVAITYAGRLEVFALSPNGMTYQNSSSNGTTWSGWVAMGGTLLSNPALAISGNVLEIFGRGTDNAVWERDFNPAAGGWTGWRSLGGVILGTPTAVRYTGSGANGVDLLARAPGNTLWWNFQPAGSGTWRGWRGLGGSVVSNPMASVYASSMQVIVTGADSTARQIYYQSALGWQGWASLGGSLTEGPWSVVWDDRFVVLGRGGDGAVWDRIYDPSAGRWLAWGSLGGQVHGP